MVALLDTNILVYLLREDAPEHAAAREWLRDASRAGDEVQASRVALAGLTRLASSPKVFRSPDLKGALGFVDGLFDAGLGLLEPGARHWGIFRELCIHYELAGNDVPDGYLAAIAIEHGATLITRDQGFDRFPELRTLDPLKAISG